jgi:hypothetical protein
MRLIAIQKAAQIGAGTNFSRVERGMVGNG